MFSLRGLQKGIFVTKLIFSTLVASGIAHAAVLENLTIGNAKALALGNGVTADPPGIDSIHFNPAGLAHLKDRQYNLKLLAAQFTFGANFGGHDDITQQTLDAYELEDEVAYSKSETSTIGLRYPLSDGVSEWPLPFLVAPLGGASYNIPGSNITFATSVYTPLAAGYIRESDDPGRYMGDELSYMKVTYFSPSVGAKLSDEWSVGASLGFSWQAISAGTELRVPNIVLAVAGELQNQLEEQEACELIGIVLDVCGLNSDVPNISPYTNVARLEYDAEAALVWNFNIGAYGSRCLGLPGDLFISLNQKLKCLAPTGLPMLMSGQIHLRRCLMIHFIDWFPACWVACPWVKPWKKVRQKQPLRFQRILQRVLVCRFCLSLK